MLLYELKNGEKIHRRDDTLIVYFPGPRRVVSTAWLNGGYRQDLQAVFNHHLPPDKHDPASLPGGSVEGYLEYLAGKLDLPYRHTAGLLTAARMENAAIKTNGFRELAVTAIVTGGIDVNGGRAGDRANYYEMDGQWVFVPGTINIILLINGNLPPHALVRSIVTATEAKTAALQELMAPSRYSRGIATGSGTDQIIAVANIQSPHYFTDAGKHAKLGELIGVTVKEAVKIALEKQTGLNPRRQCSFLARLDRYGVGMEDFWRQAREEGLGLDRDSYLARLQHIQGEPGLVALAASLIHLWDEYEWGLLPGEAVIAAGIRLLQGYGGGEACLAAVKAGDPVGTLNRLFIRVINRVILLTSSMKKENGSRN
ncbi:Adenosylcobinamide amidohydrolase, CbiZ [Moorella glycerini]|uniref:Adenosylcobinamide amidohydrolase n=1 Tax=Neomoorella stamsii TaxID=1266720 RepID=A0A9X7J3B7_9FIRM|nr:MULTISPECIES: adenosylcobinamide amidohydrolase [Moorella]PRR72835.1 Adenosylcobinamide amidohydrolase [Moorella stamsii]CEP66228.1 Adenosylcobinamide amidohydrolase, CbiZ [Moorella glycerini]